jgi:hypothetical protein
MPNFLHPIELPFFQYTEFEILHTFNLRDFFVNTVKDFSIK